MNTAGFQAPTEQEDSPFYSTYGELWSVTRDNLELHSPSTVSDISELSEISHSQTHLPSFDPTTAGNIPTTPLSIQPLYHTTNNLQRNIPGPTTSIPIPQLPSSSLATMNINNPAMTPLLQMPIRGSKLAPPLFKGKYSKVTRFVQHYNRLLEQHQVVTEADKCKGILEYCSQSVQDFIQSNPHYITPNWTCLQAEILKAYDAEHLESQIRPPDLVNFVNYNNLQPMNNLTQWRKYYREYMARAGFLRTKGQLTDLYYNGYFWYGIPKHVRSIIEEKLYARYPNHDTADPWPIDHVVGIAELHFKRDKFSERLLHLQAYGLDDEDYDSDDESEDDYESDEEDYEDERRRKKQRRHRKKKSRSQPHPQLPITKLSEEEPSRKIVPPPEENEIGGIIQQLNTMSLEDPRYGQLYYQAIKNDTSGIVAQCIRRRPIQESSSRTQYRDPPPHQSRLPPVQPPYPRGILPRPPMNNQTNNMKCYGCFAFDHILRDCPQMAIMVNRGVIRQDPRNFKYHLAENGQPLIRRTEESLMDTIKRMTPVPSKSVQFISLSSEVENFYATNNRQYEADTEESEDEDYDEDYSDYRMDWREVKGKSPTYAAYEIDDLDDDEIHQYRSYPVERNTRTTRQARDTAMKGPVKTKFDGVYPPPRKTRSSGPVQEVIPEAPQPTRQPPKHQENHIKFRTPEAPAVIEPIPVDARKPRFKGTHDIEMKEPEPKEVKRSITLQDAAKHNKPVEDKPTEINKGNQRSGPRQSELSHEVDPRAVVQELLDTQVSLPLKKILGTSKELSSNFQDMLKFKNPSPKVSSTHLVAEQNVYNSSIRPEDLPAQPDQIDDINDGMPCEEDKLLIRLTLSCKGRPVTAVIDTGSQLNVVSKSIASQCFRLPIDLSRGTYMNDANGGKGFLEGLVKNVPLNCGAVTTNASIYVGENLPFDLLLGRPWQRGNLVTIDERKEGTYLVFKNKQTWEPQFEILITPEQMYERNFKPIRRISALILANPPAGHISEITEELIEELNNGSEGRSPEKDALTFRTEDPSFDSEKDRYPFTAKESDGNDLNDLFEGMTVLRLDQIQGDQPRDRIRSEMNKFTQKKLSKDGENFECRSGRCI